MNVIIKNVNKSDDMYHIESEGGVCFALSVANIKDYVPQVGDKLHLHIECGSEIRGVDKDGKNIYYLTDAELQKRREDWLKKEKERRIQDFIAENPRLEKMFSLLPKILQHRILMFRSYIPNFRVDEEIYEMSAVFLAYKIYLHCGKTGKFEENIKNFNIPKYLHTHKLLSHYIMSYNQVEFAKYLASLITYDVREQKIDISNPTPEDIVKSFSLKLATALAPLTGSKLTPKEAFIKKYSETQKG